MGCRNIKQLFSNKSTEAQIKIFNSHCFMLPFSPYPILLINNLNYIHVASSARIFFSYNCSQDFVFLDKFHFLSLFNTCHTVSVLLPFAVQRSTYTSSRACDACVPRSLVSSVIRWCQRIECLSRVCTVFLALFVEFKMGKHKKISHSILV